jgi:hypothetical protein
MLTRARALVPSNQPLRLAALALAGVLIATGCSEKKSPRAPESGKGQGADTGSVTQTDTSTATDSSTDSDQGVDSLGIELADPSQDLTFEPGSALSVEFSLKGVEDHEVAVGFAERPDGARLEVSGANVTLTWDTPTEGSHDVKLIVRDMDECKQDAEEESDCDLSTDEVSEPKSADVVSQTYALQIGDTDSSTDDGTGTGSSNLIQQILGLLGGGAGGGGGGGGIEDLLGTLSNGQLQGLLDKLKGGAGGGGGGLQTLLDLLGGLSLSGGDEQP